jgi:hypothetical protein
MPFLTKSIDGKKDVQVRATLAVAFGAAIIVGFFTKLLNPDQFLAIATMCITWYFAKRNTDEDKKPSN